MNLFRRVAGGLGFVAPRSCLQIWIDCVPLSLADSDELRADLVVVPPWPLRTDVVSALHDLPWTRLVVELDADDRSLLSLAMRLGLTRVVWTDGVCRVEPRSQQERVTAGFGASLIAPPRRLPGS